MATLQQCDVLPEELGGVSPYEIVGVNSTATEKQIRSAYRSRARELHPDKNPNDEQAQARFERLSKAFEFLCDPKLRTCFDECLEAEQLRKARIAKQSAEKNEFKRKLEERETQWRRNQQSELGGGSAVNASTTGKEELVKRLRRQNEELLQRRQNHLGERASKLRADLERSFKSDTTPIDSVGDPATRMKSAENRIVDLRLRGVGKGKAGLAVSRAEGEAVSDDACSEGNLESLSQRYLETVFGPMGMESSTIHPDASEAEVTFRSREEALNAVLYVGRMKGLLRIRAKLRRKVAEPTGEPPNSGTTTTGDVRSGVGSAGVKAEFFGDGIFGFGRRPVVPRCSDFPDPPSDEMPRESKAAKAESSEVPGAEEANDCAFLEELEAATFQSLKMAAANQSAMKAKCPVSKSLS